ncbi:hypothetical protein D9M72_482940 [compost metagenome]
MVAKLLGKPVQLIAVRHAGGVQRALVQRPEQDRVGLARLRQLQCQRQRSQAVAPALGTGFGARIRRALRQLPVVQARLAIVGKGGRIGLGQRQLDACDPHAVAPFVAVGDQQDLGLRGGRGVGQQPGDQFGADAGGVAQHHGDSWTGIHWASG